MLRIVGRTQPLVSDWSVCQKEGLAAHFAALICWLMHPHRTIKFIWSHSWWGFLIYPHNRMGTRLQSPVPRLSSSCDNDATPTLLLVIYILSAVHILTPVNENMMFSVANSLRFYIHYHTWIRVSLHFGHTRRDFKWFPSKMSQDLPLQDKFFSSRKHFCIEPRVPTWSWLSRLMAQHLIQNLTTKSVTGGCIRGHQPWFVQIPRQPHVPLSLQFHPFTVCRPDGPSAPAPIVSALMLDREKCRTVLWRAFCFCPTTFESLATGTSSPGQPGAYKSREDSGRSQASNALSQFKSCRSILKADPFCSKKYVHAFSDSTLRDFSGCSSIWLLYDLLNAFLTCKNQVSPSQVLKSCACYVNP